MTDSDGVTSDPIPPHKIIDVIDIIDDEAHYYYNLHSPARHPETFIYPRNVPLTPAARPTPRNGA